MRRICARRQKRGRRTSTASAGTRNSTCRLTKWNGRQAEARGDRRARGQGQDDAEDDQAPSAAEQPAVDRPPPFARVERSTRETMAPTPSRRSRRLARAWRSNRPPGTRRRASRNWGIGRTRRRRATAARRARRRPRLAHPAPPPSTAAFERAGDFMRHRFAERRGEVRPPRRSDRPCGCAERTAAATRCRRSWLAAGDPENVVEAGSACAAASALVALESLTNSTLPRRPTSSMRCAQARERAQAGLDRARPKPSARRRSRARRRSAHCAVPRSDADAAELGNRSRLGLRLRDDAPSRRA